MSLLIYGFGPYRQFKENITEKIIRSLPAKKGVKKVVFPVRFHKGQLIQAIQRYKPDVILGLGQCSRGRRLKIERRALNKRRESKGERPRPIAPGGPRSLATSLSLNGAKQARVSYYAGDYVCNFSMYVILDFLKHHRLPIPFGFIHIPQDYNIEKAKRYLLRVVDTVQGRQLGRKKAQT